MLFSTLMYVPPHNFVPCCICTETVFHHHVCLVKLLNESNHDNIAFMDCNTCGDDHSEGDLLWGSMSSFFSS